MRWSILKFILFESIRKRNTRNQRKLSNPCFAVGSSFAISDGRSTTEISSKDLSEYLRDETVEIDTGNSSVETEKSVDAAGVAVGDRRGQRSWEPAIASCFLPLSLSRVVRRLRPGALRSPSYLSLCLAMEVFELLVEQMG